MKQILVALLLILAFGCKSKSGENKLQVSGKITNHSAQMIYLEEIPMTTMERIVVDSFKLEKDGSYELSTTTGEARVYNLRLDQNNFPLAAVINDAKKITLNATFSKENTQFPDKYEVKGSPASEEMRAFMTSFNNKLQLIIADAQKADSLYRLNPADSSLGALEVHARQTAAEVKALTLSALEKSSNAALSMFILGYYQSTANYAGSGLQGLAEDEVKNIVNDIAKKFPTHQGVLAIQSTFNNAAKGWVGQQAPEITLPDPNGKDIKLSSFRGKYVLVDFWASWCKPCRDENPNVVSAYNKYKDKNFTILGVSLDQPGQKDEWMKAVMNDGLKWTHVSDLSHWNSPVVQLYRIESIPYNVLIDPAGKIIAESLYGEDLSKKLEEVLK